VRDCVVVSPKMLLPSLASANVFPAGIPDADRDWFDGGLLREEAHRGCNGGAGDSSPDPFRLAGDAEQQDTLRNTERCGLNLCIVWLIAAIVALTSPAPGVGG